MSLLERLREAITPHMIRRVIHENTAVRHEALKLKTQAERTIEVIDHASATGVWHQDLIEARGRYAAPLGVDNRD